MSIIHELIVSAFMPIAKERERQEREVNHHWPAPVPDGCTCQDKKPPCDHRAPNCNCFKRKS